MQILGSLSRTWRSSLKLGVPASAVLGLISDLGAPIGDLIFFALAAALAVTGLSGIACVASPRKDADSAGIRGSLFAFGLVSSVVLGGVFGLNRLASASPDAGFLASHVESLRVIQGSLVRVEGQLDKLDNDLREETARAEARSTRQSEELTRIREGQVEARRLAEERERQRLDEELRKESEVKAREAAARARHEEQLRMAEQLAEETRKASQASAERDAAAKEQARRLDGLIDSHKKLVADLASVLSREGADGNGVRVAREALSKIDTAIEEQLAGGADSISGPRGQYLRAREADRKGDAQEAGRLYAEYAQECADEFDPLVDYADYLERHGAVGAALAEMRRLHEERGLLCAGLLAALRSPLEAQIGLLEELRQAQPGFELPSLFLGRKLVESAQASGDRRLYARAASELRLASVALRERRLDAYVLDRKQRLEWIAEIERTLPLITAWEAAQIVAKEPPRQGDCIYSALQLMRERRLTSEFGSCEGFDFILYSIRQSEAEAASPDGATLAMEAGRRAIANWLESDIRAVQKAATSSTREADGKSRASKSFSSSSVSTSDVVQSGIQLYSTQPHPEGGLEHVFLLSSKAATRVRAMRNSVREAGPDGSVCVEARGMVSITGRDEAEARDAALSAAKQDAIGQVVGFRTRTVFSQVGQELDQQASVSHGKGYIQSFRINVDVRRGDIYVVEIEACVSLRELDKQIGDAMKALGRPKIVVECPAGHLRTKIEAELDAARIPVTKDEGLASYLVRADLSYEEYSRKLGTQERAATRLNSILVLVDRDTRETACHASLPEVRSFLGGADERRRDCQRQLVAAPAPADAAESEAQESPQEQLEQFLGCVRDEFRRLADEGRPVFIEISHPRAANDPVATLLRGLKNLPGATAIEQELYSDTSASMQLRFLGESRWLAEILQREFDDIAADAGYRLKRKEVTPRVVRLSVDTP